MHFHSLREPVAPTRFFDRAAASGDHSGMAVRRLAGADQKFALSMIHNLVVSPYAGESVLKAAALNRML